jgi:hypothetical protein
LVSPLRLWDLRAAVARANKKLADELAADGAVDPIPFVSPNDLRRAFASWLVHPLLVVAALLGHSSTRVVEKVYGRLSAKNMDDAIAVLPSFGTVTTVSANCPQLAQTVIYLTKPRIAARSADSRREPSVFSRAQGRN